MTELERAMLGLYLLGFRFVWKFKWDSKVAYSISEGKQLAASVHWTQDGYYTGVSPYNKELLETLWGKKDSGIIELLPWLTAHGIDPEKIGKGAGV